jgi:iron complex transport system substrate-binding protein
MEKKSIPKAIGLGLAAAALLVSAVAMLLCAHGPASDPAASPTDAGPERDRFPVKLVIRHARGFSIRYAKAYKVVEIINPFSTAPDTTRYVLVPRGAPRPEGFPGATMVAIPVRTLACFSTTHIGLTDFLGANDRIIAMSDTGRIVNADVLGRSRAGKIAEVGREQALNQEKLLALAPDLVMTVGFPGKEIGAFRSLLESGIAVVANSEWKEATLLGRMEWVKLLAAFLDKDSLAQAKCDSVEAEYEKIKGIAAGAAEKPKVIGGTSRKGVWTVPGGRSYVAALLRDAGSSYPFADDTTTGSRNLGFETVYREGLDAEVWLNAGWNKSLRDIAAEDDRYRDFKSFRNKRVYGNTKRMGANGSNDYWESGLVNPQLILADMVKILHPQLLPGYELRYSLALE